MLRVMSKNHFLLFFFFCLLNLSNANIDSSLRYTNAIYEGDIRSVTLKNASSGFNFPVISLGDIENKLEITFDQLTATRDNYFVTLIHCDANWNRTLLPKTQYLDGIGFESIDDISFSTGTLTQYVHYSIKFPSENLKPKISGNYLVLIYRNFEEEDIVLSRRIMVLDNKGSVDVQIVLSSQVEFRQEQQQVNFSFTKTTDNYFIPNPYQELNTRVLRNGEWESSISTLKPQFIRGNVYQYNQMIGTQFDGLNEYRYFDIRSLQTAQAGVKLRRNIANQKHVWLISHKSRGFDQYMNWKDFNGRVFYDNKDLPLSNGNNFESDYCFVHFSLISEPISHDIYIYGELSDWSKKEDYKMFYNQETKQYEAVIPLKQAYYNYAFGVENEPGKLDFKLFEGSHSVAENNYMVLVYHRNQTMPYDELIGYGLKNSQPTR